MQTQTITIESIQKTMEKLLKNENFIGESFENSKDSSIFNPSNNTPFTTFFTKRYVCN